MSHESVKELKNTHSDYLDLVGFIPVLTQYPLENSGLGFPRDEDEVECDTDEEDDDVDGHQHGCDQCG